ncbi:sigma-70 family RNA polymerase sigma factor [Terrabacter lapilli]|uniref:RNA polymerase sigma factor n=1 Tax=Terrabacter lapilli TaxID=436231 RepID=UPI0031D100E3
MRANRTSAPLPRPVPAPGRAPARGLLTRTRLSLPALVLAHAGGPAVAGAGVPAYDPVLPGLPTWRSALDALWASLADEGVDLARTGPGGPGPRRLERDSDEQLRIAALVQLAQDGDKEAFAQLYDVYVDTVFRYVLVRVANRALAEDLTSETFVRAMRRIDSFTWQGKDIAAWFVTIARNLIADHVKSARFRFEVATADMRDADERVDAPDTEVLTRLRDERLVSAIKELGPDQAECITLRFLQGLSLADTARVLGKSEGAVKQLQLRATRALRKALEGVEL